MQTDFKRDIEKLKETITREDAELEKKRSELNMLTGEKQESESDIRKKEVDMRNLEAEIRQERMKTLDRNRKIDLLKREVPGLERKQQENRSELEKLNRELQNALK
jgi:chromosome segregation ATPase